MAANETLLTLGECIRQLREETDLSLRELARRIGVTAPFLSDVELGRRFPSDKHLEAIARALETPIEDLKQSDTRPPMRELRKMIASDPEYGFAFRRMIDNEVSPTELIKFVESRSKERKRKKRGS